MSNARPFRRYCAVLNCALVLAWSPVAAPAADNEPWTLERSVRRFLSVAPEAQEAEAAVQTREGALHQAGRWPNPELELRADDKIGKDSGSGGNDFTQLAFSQPLPLSGRIGQQQAIAQAELDTAHAAQREQRLRLEAHAANSFHTLQLSEEKLRLAQERLALADRLQEAGLRREQAGEMARLERLRLDIIREATQQELDAAETGYQEALTQFRSTLTLPAGSMLRTSPLEAPGPAPGLAELETELAQHPAMIAAQTRLQAAHAGVALARTERLPDPTLRLFRERDFLNGRTQDVTGVGLALTVPLWDRKSGSIDAAQAEATQSQSRLDTVVRDLSNELRASHIRLTGRIGQADHYRDRIFEPAREVFELTRKAYATGEAEILALIDANDTYFTTRARYLELLQEAWLALADLRLAAGRALITTEQDTHDE